MAYPVLADCKTYMAVAGSGDDSVITQELNAAITFVEEYCDRTFLEADPDTISILPDYPNLRGKYILLVTDYDLVSVTSITNGDDKAVVDYVLYPLSGPPYYQIEIDKDAGQVWNRGSNGSGLVSLTGVTGRAAVPADVTLAILDLVTWMYRSRSSGAGGPVTTASREGLTIAPSEIPPSILQVLDLRAKL